MKAINSSQPKRLYEFGPFRLDEAERRLSCNNQIVKLTPKAFDTLLVLVESGGRLLQKDGLIRAVWPETFVDENTLTSNISTLRKALGQNNGDQYIETVPKLGYRFVASVRELQLEPGDLLIQKRTRSRLVIRQETEVAGATRNSGAGMTGRPTLWRRVTPSVVIPVILVVLATVAGTGYLLASRHGSSNERAPRLQSIAVLPFKPLGVGADEEFLGLGMADALITRLGRINQLKIRPTGAIQKYRDGERDVAAIGRELNVDAVLDGRIHKADGRLRVTAQLLNVREGALLWTEKFDLDDSDMFAVEDSISGEVARAVIPELTGEDKARLAKRYTENSEAYQAFLKGRYFWEKRTCENNLKSIEMFRQAIDLDPSFARAYAGLADAYNFSDQLRTEKEPLVKAAARKALELDESLAEAHTTLANVSLFDDWNWPEAETEFRRAIELNPNYPTAHHWFAYYLACRGRLDEALVEIRRAQELDPLSLIINTDVGHLLYLARDYDRSIIQLRRTLEMDPTFVMAHFHLGEVYDGNAMYQDAISEFQKVGPGLSNMPRPEIIGHSYARTGNRGAALRFVKHLTQQVNGGRTQPAQYWMAAIYAALGDKDQAFGWLERDFAERGVQLIFLKVDPMLDSLRSDPRYADLLRRMNLPS